MTLLEHRQIIVLVEVLRRVRDVIDSLGFGGGRLARDINEALEPFEEKEEVES